MLIKLSIVVGAFYFIYQKLINNPELSFRIFTSFLSKNEVFLLKNIIFLLFLSIFNWFFEILKWQILVSPIRKIDFKSALKQSLGALTASLFTPNRIGEYGAKAMFFTTKFRKRILLVNLLGNMMQMTVTVILGVIGLYFFVEKYQLEINYYKLLPLIFILLILILIFIFLILKNKFTIKGVLLEKIRNFIWHYPKDILVLGFLFSILRYAFFSFQFYYLLHLFGVDITYFNAMIIITSMYLLASIIPSVFIFDVIIKGSVALYLFILIGVNELTILSIVMLMWLLNFVLPSIFGSFYVLNFKFPKDSD